MSSSSSSSSLKKHNYKYVVIGYGVAGRNAVNVLLNEDRQKDNQILIIEKKKNISVPNDNRINVTHHSVKQISADQHQVILDDGQAINYKKLLIACGRQYGITDSELVDKRCKSKVIDLSSAESITTLTNTVKSGGHVTLLGGSWISIALASYLAHEATLSGYTSSVTLLIPGSAPLHEVLPRPFTLAIVNRLKRIGVEVFPYMQLRYIGVKESLTDDVLPTQDLQVTNQSNQASNPNKFSDWDNVVGVHCVQSYDVLKTYMFATDYVVPICELANDFDDNTSENSFLHKAGFELDSSGCLIANPSLAVVDGVYAAGDIANIYYENGRGYNVGLLSANATGSIAAQNMISSFTNKPSILSSNILNTYHATALLMGANIRFYGECSNSLDTFSYWWHTKKNSSAQTVSDPNIIDDSSDMKKNAIVPLGKLSTRKVSLSSDHISLNFSLYSPTASSVSSNEPSIHQSETDILGTGIIFYVDSNYVIKGIAVCGTMGNPYFLNHYINMSPAYTKAASYLNHKIDLPLFPSKRLSSVPTSSIDINQQTKYLESIAIEIFNQIEKKIPPPTNNKIIKFNELDEKPKCKFSIAAGKRSNNQKETQIVNEKIQWRSLIQSSNKNEKLFH